GSWGSPTLSRAFFRGGKELQELFFFPFPPPPPPVVECDCTHSPEREIHMATFTRMAVTITETNNVIDEEQIQFSKVAEVQRTGTSLKSLTLQAQWRSSNQQTITTTTANSEDFAIGALEIEAIVLKDLNLFFAVQAEVETDNDGKNYAPSQWVLDQMAKKWPVARYGFLLYNGPVIKIQNEWDETPTPFFTLINYLTGETDGSPFNDEDPFPGLLFLDCEAWGDVDGNGAGNWDADDYTAYRRLYSISRREQPSSQIMCIGLPQRNGADRDHLKDHVDIGAPFFYLLDWNPEVIQDIIDRINYCTDVLKLRCVAFISGKFSGRDVVPENRRNQWIGGYRLQTILSTIRDKTNAEGLIVWGMEEDMTDQDLGQVDQIHAAHGDGDDHTRVSSVVV
ncbi:MAG: hypothetical protein ACR2GY_02995, partial [Phycisphaerales bacterium]